MTQREYTRQDDEFELALMAWLESQGVEIYFDENERESFLSELFRWSFAAYRKSFGGLS